MLLEKAVHSKGAMKKTFGFYIKWSIGLAIFLLIAIFAYFNSRNLVEGPVISIDSPKNGELEHTNLISITGTVKNASAVWIDDRKIFLDQNNHFNEKLLLPLGYTIITIKAENRFGTSAQKTLTVVYNQ
jgi:Glucodextranase, domain B